MKTSILIALVLSISSKLTYAECAKDYPTEHAPTSISAIQNISIPDGQRAVYIFKGAQYNNYEDLKKAQQAHTDKLRAEGKIVSLDDIKLESLKYCQISRSDLKSTSGSLSLKPNESLNFTLDPVTSRIIQKPCFASYFSMYFTNSAGKKLALSCAATSTYADMFANLNGIIDVGCPKSLETGSADPEQIRKMTEDIKNILSPNDKTLTGQIPASDQSLAVCLPGA